MTQHHVDQRQPVEVGDRAAADVAAVPQHADAVSDGIDLIQKMRDEDDRKPPIPQPPDDTEQALHLLRIEAGRRFVKDQHLAGQRDGAGDGDDLLDGDGIGTERSRHVDGQVVIGQHGARRLALGAAPDQSACGRLPSDQQVFCDRQVRQ